METKNVLKLPFDVVLQEPEEFEFKVIFPSFPPRIKAIIPCPNS